MRSAWLCAVVLPVFLVLGGVGCSSSRRYSEADVKRAFRKQGLDLRVGTVNGRELQKGGDVLLVPRSGASFWVGVVHSEKEARSYYRTLVGQKAVGTFDCVRANVITGSDGGLLITQRRQLQMALEGLGPKPPHVR